jgi:hypothetical protein
MRVASKAGVIAMVLVCGWALPVSATVTYSTIALSGAGGGTGPGSIPGLAAGVTFAELAGQQPSINDAGVVAFRGTLNVAGNPAGIWTSSGGVNSNQQVAGGARPGGGAYAATDGFNGVSINNAGNVAFRLNASSGIFASSGGVYSRAALVGDLATGAGGAAFSTIATGTPLFNSAGQVAYFAALATNASSTPPVVTTTGVANNNALWIGTPASQSLVLRQNDALLSLDAGGAVRVGALSTLTVSFNGAGRFVTSTALQGTVTTGTGAGSNSAAIVSNRSGSTQVLARVGDAAPTATGAPSTTDLFRTMPTNRIGFNDAGNVVFTSTLRNSAGTQTATAALFSDVGGPLRQLARTGEAVPTITGAIGSEFAGVTWGASFGTPVVNAGGLIGVSAGLANTGATTNTTVLLTVNPVTGTLTRIARSGDVAVVNGSPIVGDAFFSQLNDIALNSSGQMVFSSTLTGNSVSVGLGNGSALFAYDPVLGLQMIARTGDQFEVAPGDFRTISTIGGIVASGGQDGRSRTLNDLGVATFALGFTGGTSGIFTAVIPSPGVAGVFGLGLLAAGRRRR